MDEDEKKVEELLDRLKEAEARYPEILKAYGRADKPVRLAALEFLITREAGGLRETIIEQKEKLFSLKSARNNILVTYQCEVDNLRSEIRKHTAPPIENFVNKCRKKMREISESRRGLPREEIDGLQKAIEVISAMNFSSLREIKTKITVLNEGTL